MKTPLLIAALSLLCFLANAQTDTCITNLKNAGNDYDQGNYDHAISLLNATLKGCPLSKSDRIGANKLLILCYLGIDNLEAADNAAAAIMKIDPNYAPDKFKDDPKLAALFSKYKPQPMLSVGISGGINWPSIDVVKTYSVVHGDDEPGLASYQSVISYQLGASIELRLYKNLWGEAGVQFRNTQYKHVLDSVEGSTVYYSEKLNYLDFPVSLKYYFLKSPFTPFIQAGADFSYLTQALSTTSRDAEEDLVNRTALRNRFTIGYFGAAGVSYSLKGFNVFANFRYTYFPHLVNEPGKRYDDDINLYKYYYIDDDFKMDNLQVNVGASYTLTYKIKKVK